MKRTVIVVLLTALVVAGLAVPAYAGHGYGKQVNDGCLGVATAR